MTVETYKFLMLDLLARLDRKEPEVSYITKPLSVLDAFRFYECSGYLTDWCEAAIELHAERLAWAESRNGMIYLQSSMPVLDYQGDMGDEQPRTLNQIRCELAAKELERRKQI